MQPMQATLSVCACFWRAGPTRRPRTMCVHDIVYFGGVILVQHCLRICQCRTVYAVNCVHVRFSMASSFSLTSWCLMPFQFRVLCEYLHRHRPSIVNCFWCVPQFTFGALCRGCQIYLAFLVIIIFKCRIVSLRRTMPLLPATLSACAF